MDRTRSGVAVARPSAARRPAPVRMTEALEGRTMLAAQWPGAVVGVTPGSTAAGLVYPTLVDSEGGDVMVREHGTALRINRSASPSPRAAAAPAAGGFDIVLNQGPNLAANLLAAAAFEQAAAFFESIFHDPITVFIDAEIAPLPGNQLGIAASVIFGDTFDTIRDAVVADASPADEAFVAGLPNEAGFSATLPDGSYTLDGMRATRANLLALGVPPAELPAPPSDYVPGMTRDATITFSSNYPFDYDRSDGISSGLSDFIGVAIHEIGHSLGFVSAVDDVDGFLSGGGRPIGVMPLDLFRFGPGAGGANFAGGTRILSPGSVVSQQVFYDGGVFDPSGISAIGGLSRGDIPLSTGGVNGDNNSASHWKDESFIGLANPLGVMDPVLTAGRQANWTAADQRAFALIGWDTTPAAAQAGVSGSVYDDANANGSFDPGGGEVGLGGVIVYHDANNNGVFDSGIADRFAPAAGLPRGIPDPGTVESRIVVDDLPGVVRDVNVTVTVQHPYTFDLEVTLISPSGREVTLFDDVGQEDFFGRSEDFSGTILDDEVGARIQDGEPPFAGRYQPEQPLSIMDGETMNGTWTLRLRDWVPVDEGMLIDWGLTFDNGEGEPRAISEGDGAYAFPDLAPGDYRFRQVLLENYRQTQPTGNAAYVLTLAEGQQVTGRNFGQATGVPASTVAGRHVFYNRSAFDGFNPAANAQDDAAIATDKTALMPGQGATFANYTSYSRGINGVMVDVVNLPAGAGPTAADFAFKAGNGNDASAWPDLLVAPEISFRRGAGAGGSDRITLTWPDNSILRQWLQVTVNGTANTGLANPDVFTFGNLPGETGNPAGPTRVDATDVLSVRAALGAAGQPINNPLDFNRDRRVNSSDYATARANVGRSLERPTSGGAAASGLFSEIPVANRRTPYRPVRAWIEATAAML